MEIRGEQACSGSQSEAKQRADRAGGQADWVRIKTGGTTEEGDRGGVGGRANSKNPGFGARESGKRQEDLGVGGGTKQP